MFESLRRKVIAAPAAVPVQSVRCTNRRVFSANAVWLLLQIFRWGEVLCCRVFLCVALLSADCCVFSLALSC